MAGVEKAFKSFARFLLVGHSEKKHRTMVCIADTAVVDYFALPSVSGDTREILRRPGAAMVTALFARKLFGDADPIGQVVSVDYKFGLKGEWIIHGLLQDPPEMTDRISLRIHHNHTSRSDGS